MKKITFIIAITLFSVIAFAQEETTSKTQSADPMDISSQLSNIKEHGIPTIEFVNNLAGNADSLFKNSEWEDAIDAYILFAEKANWLANIMATCLEPYYSASYKKKEQITFSKLSQFYIYETLSNAYKVARNDAYVKIGICYKNTGNSEQSIAYLLKALDLLSVSEYENWEIAKNMIGEIIGMPKDEK